MQFTGKINAKKLAATGITEDHLSSMANRLGGATLAIVELHHDSKVIDENGDTEVRLLLTLCEPVPDAMEDTVRDLMRALYRTRPEVAGQAALTGVEDGQSPEDAAAAVDANIERDDEGEPVGVWSGDDDQAATAGKGTALAAVPDGDNTEGQCPAPLCGKPIDHDGDHGPADA